MANDDPDVYFNITNELFYWIEPETNKVMYSDYTGNSPDIAWRTPEILFEDCDPANRYAVLFKV
jgi:hypothetical protein